jgi:hypothetical protein
MIAENCLLLEYSLKEDREKILAISGQLQGSVLLSHRSLFPFAVRL